MFSHSQNTKEVTCPLKHTLVPTNNLSEIHQGHGYDGDQYFCETCRNVFNSRLFPSNHCKLCGFDLCYNCYDAQKVVEINCFKDHPLFIVPALQQFANYESNYYSCNSCNANFDSTTTPPAHCRQCGFDLCPNCLHNAQTQKQAQYSGNNDVITRSVPQWEQALKAGNNQNDQQRTRQIACPQGHILGRVDNLNQLYPKIAGIYSENGYNCDTCRRNYNCAENNTFHCKMCVFDMCPKCEEKAQKINFTCPSGHQLYIVSALNGFHENTGAYANNTFGCNSCKVTYDAGFHPSCHCRNCGYDLCPTCAETRMKEINHHDQQQIQAQNQHIQQIEQLSSILKVAPGKEPSEDMLCVLCLNAPRSHLFNPCKHLCTCEDCSRDLVNRRLGCPICRSQIFSSTKVFMS